jgi:DNA-binding CsgD family transcriptional regulator
MELQTSREGDPRRVGAGSIPEADRGAPLAGEVTLRPDALLAALRNRDVHLLGPERRHLSRALDSLTRREVDVVYAVFLGGPNAGIAQRLGVRMTTLRTHITRINHKLGAERKSDIVRLVAAALLEGYRTGRIAADLNPFGASGAGTRAGKPVPRSAPAVVLRASGT